MEKINYYSGLIDRAIEVINTIDTNRTPCIFLRSDQLLYQLQQAVENVSNINLFEIEDEIWKSKKQFKNEADTLIFINKFFFDLFHWKEGLNSIKEVLESTDNDMSTFGVRLVNAYYSSSEQAEVRKLYSQIAVKLHQIKQDYKEICDRFIQRIKAPEEQKNLSFSWSNIYNFKLNKEYAPQVAEYLNFAIDKEWFTVVDPEKQLLKIDILNAFGYYLGCPFPEIKSEDNSLLSVFVVEQTDTVADQNQKHEIDLFASHLLHTQPLLLADKIRVVFNIEKGKSIQLLLKALAENDPQLIAIANRNFKTVYNALKQCLGRDIGSYQSVKGYVYNETADRQDFEAIKQKLNHALTNLG